jgi:murein DD-endopeptidase MepM/ murein hydrolase activator NlpD
VPAYLPTSVLRPESIPQAHSFLRFSRRHLGIGAIVACMTLMSIPALPATADIVETEVKVINLQTYSAPAVAITPAVIRDSFATSAYSVVQWPVPSTTTVGDQYGPRSCSGCTPFHHGVDFNPGAGFPVQAIADGVVTEIGNPNGELGVYVIIAHVIDGETVSSIYGHMELGSMTLSVGDAVARGQVVGLVGDTGQSTGPHLHFGIMLGTETVDPLLWIQAHANS